MTSSTRKTQVIQKVTLLPKFELFLHFITALRAECYRYAGILRDEIVRRSFTQQEMIALQSSSFYPLLNGVLNDR